MIRTAATPSVGCGEPHGSRTPESTSIRALPGLRLSNYRRAGLSPEPRVLTAAARSYLPDFGEPPGWSRPMRQRRMRVIRRHRAFSRSGLGIRVPLANLVKAANVAASW